uniref:hypothetical protein n=1 Tax=Faecalimicrobium dakarense TaxID=1301100 RepID=UPI0005A9A019
MVELQEEMVQISKELNSTEKLLLNGKSNTFTIQAGANAETRSIVTTDLSKVAVSIGTANITNSKTAQSFVQTV